METVLQQGLALPESVQIAIVLSNCIIRLAAIAGGIYVAKLGHDTILRDAKGEFKYEGVLGKLEGKIPGPLFILLGVGAIGWALSSPVQTSVKIQGGTDELVAPDASSPAGSPGALPFPKPGSSQ